jgi:sortase (surface protein transpeptidase)
LATGAAVLVFGVGISIFASTLKTNKQVVAQVAQVAQQNDSTSKPAAAGAGVPIEKSVTQSDVNSYRVAANMPRLLRIAKLGVVSRVTQVDQIAATGVLDTPKNIYDTGWYKQSSIPGDAGAALIVGHVHGPIAPGVFYNIKNLVAGDIITVERGDSKALNFKVVKKDQVATDKIDMAAALTPVTAGKPGLNIMTCGGKYNTAKNEYEDRITVYAEQV